MSAGNMNSSGQTFEDLVTIGRARKRAKQGPKLVDKASGSEHGEVGRVASGTPTLAAVNPNRKPVELTAERETDLGNAEDFVRRQHGTLRYVASWHKWLDWDGQRWQMLPGDPIGRAAAAAKEYAHEMHAALAEVQGAIIAAGGAKADSDAAQAAKEAKKDYEWAVRSQDARRLRATLEIACDLPGVPIAFEKLDANPWALNVKNGILDLRTGELNPHDPEALCTKLAPVTFDPEATCPTWEAFLDRAMGGNQALVTFLQRMVGYSLTGVIREHVLAFAFGGGANGKSTFLGALREALGDYAMQAPRTLLFGAKGEHPTTLASLFGVRMAICPEVDEAATFDESLLKDITGGDTITARRMREDFWPFQPTHKLFLAGNHKPRVRGTDEGVWRRIKLIPWLVTIPKAERDTELPDKLRAEYPGILNWALRGCLAWQQDGLGEPREVTEATGAYREESDLLGRFLAESCVFAPEARIQRKLLRETYEEWCRDLGAQPVGAKKFAEGLRIRGVTDKQVRMPGMMSPTHGWAGVRLRTALEVDRDV